MSSELAMEFGQQFGSEYAAVITTWATKLDGVTELNDRTKSEWSSNLIKVLGVGAAAVLLKKVVPNWNSSGFVLPSLDTLKMFLKIATLGALGIGAHDLLERLRSRSNEEPVVSEMAIRAPQTVAQMFDMIKDFFGRIVERFNQRKGNLTGRRRWRTVGAKSRHGGLEGEIKNEGESFSYKGESIYGPRPSGGSPGHWSNCSCFLEVELKNGDWVAMR